MRTLWLLAALAVGPGAARADAQADFQAHVANATQAHEAGRFDEALFELEAAYVLDPRPDLLYAIGQVHAKLGNCEQAAASFRQFAAARRTPKVTSVVEQAITACKPGPAPEPSTGAGLPEATPADEPLVQGDPPPATPAPLPTEPAPAAAVTRRRTPWYKDKLGDALVLGGVVATAVGLVEYRGARSDLDTAEDTSSTTSLARYQELVDDARGKRATSVVLIGTGGVLVAAGIVRYVLRGGATEPRGIALAPARGGGVVTYGGSF